MLGVEGGVILALTPSAVSPSPPPPPSFSLFL